jgi:FGGY-family pentulose kinase
MVSGQREKGSASESRWGRSGGGDGLPLQPQRAQSRLKPGEPILTQDRRCYIGIDVGTGSARAGVFDADGRMLGQSTHPIKMWKPQADFVEQSSDDIWSACAAAVRQAVTEADIDATNVRGIGFDATCSLVALDESDRPVSVSPTGNDEQNVIVWMDHRALEQTARINEGGHAVLSYVGGIISPEMESPKLGWLRENLPDCWKRTRRFFDLADFLTYRATGDETRSLCTTVCKWTYQGHLEPTIPGSVGSWDDTYWQSIGLGELASEGYRRIGTRIRPMGEPIAHGLTERAAAEFGLTPGTPVAVSIIDAHAGGVGMLGAPLAGSGEVDLQKRLALIGGTSSCHMAVSKEPRFVNGVWGPFYSAMIPGLWLTEGGQSATGALIDHIIFSHVRSRELEQEAKQRGITVYEILAEVLDKLASNTEFPAELTRELHVLPDFHGNRSPRANPNARGMISGLKLSDSLEDLALLYLATVQAVAHGTRHILDAMTESGYEIETVLTTGGGAKNPIFLREHADITGRKIVLPKEPEAVLLGSAMLGAVAAGDCATLTEAMTKMSAADKIIEPFRGAVATYHDAKHEVFLRMYEDQMNYRDLMNRKYIGAL